MSSTSDGESVEGPAPACGCGWAAARSASGRDLVQSKAREAGSPAPRSPERASPRSTGTPPGRCIDLPVLRFRSVQGAEPRSRRGVDVGRRRGPPTSCGDRPCALTSRRNPSIISSHMRLSGPVRSATATVLLALFGVLGTGVPTHHHEAPAPAEGPLLLSADHHSHGTELVEHDERTPSGGPQITAAAAVGVMFAPPTDTPVETRGAELLRPTERAPPPGAPRAPPHSA